MNVDLQADTTLELIGKLFVSDGNGVSDGDGGNLFRSSHCRALL